MKELILKIASFHPDSEAGRKRGWSHYTGGMADSGDWDFRKLLNATENELKECLFELEHPTMGEYKPLKGNTPEEKITDLRYRLDKAFLFGIIE